MKLAMAGFGGIAAFIFLILGLAQRASADANGNYITQVYQDLLQAPPSSSDLTMWDTFLTGGGTRFNFVIAVEAKPAYLDLLIDKQFSNYLKRSPTGLELSNLRTAMSGGTTVEQMQSSILGTPEFFTDSGGANPGFIDALYPDVLNRPPNLGELTGWENILGSGGVRSDVALVLLSGNEYEQDFVTGAYQQFLRRAPITTELNSYVNDMSGGATDQDVIADLLSTDEYFNRAQTPEPSAIAGMVLGFGLISLRRRRFPKVG